MMKGRAVVFTDRLQVRYQEVDVPEPLEHEVVIDVEFSWVSIGTESSFLRGERIAGETPAAEGVPLPFPQINGYQKTGVVRSVGAQVEGIAPGDRVFATMSRVERMAFASGGHVSPAVTPASEVWKLPPGADPIAYSGMVLAQVGYNCGARPEVRPGDAAVVIGDGLVGHWAAHTLLHRGANVVVLGRHDDRLRLLPGAVAGRNVASTTLDEALAGLRDGLAIVVDTVGTLPAVYELLPRMRHNGHLVSAGFLGTQGAVDIQRLRPKELTLHCPSGWEKRRMDATLEAIRDGWMLTTPLITHTFPVEEAESAWELILDKQRPCLGVVFDWRGG